MGGAFGVEGSSVLLLQGTFKLESALAAVEEASENTLAAIHLKVPRDAAGILAGVEDAW